MLIHVIKPMHRLYLSLAFPNHQPACPLVQLDQHAFLLLRRRRESILCNVQFTSYKVLQQKGTKQRKVSTPMWGTGLDCAMFTQTHHLVAQGVLQV